jgi:hypothetical protein
MEPVVAETPIDGIGKRVAEILVRGAGPFLESI